MSRKLTITVIMLLILAFGAGVVAGMKLNTGCKCGEGLTLESGENTFKAGYEAAKKRLADSGFFPMLEMEIKAVFGEVTEVKDGRLALRIRPLEPLADQDLDTRIILADSHTKIYELAQRDQDEYQKEMEDFSRIMQAQMSNPSAETASLTPPEMFTKKEVKITDIRIGQNINVVSDENIRSAKEIRAAEITFHAIPQAPVAMPPMPDPAPLDN